ncbi:calcium/sodium antiporter [Candidatus Sumerlaeota bacterium]|nr:calcium/sodium antiporter [Candidatus Sumerlaeota bacterium]
MESFVPQSVVEWFAGLPTLALIGLLSVGILVLGKGADLLVDGAVGISRRLGVPKVIVGATVVSVGTTMPEAAVSVLAAFQGRPDLALGNAVGSIVCDTCLIFGLASLITRLPKDRHLLNRQGWIVVGATVLLVLLSILYRDESGRAILPRFVGFGFVTLLAGYMALSVYWARRPHEPVEEAIREEGHETARSVLGALAMFVPGIVLILIGGQVMLHCVEEICLRWGVPHAVVGATIMALGTSFPELVTAIASIVKGHKEIVVGNLIGADVLNVLFVSGAALCASPLVVEPLFFRLHYVVMIAAVLLFRVNIFWGGKTFARWPGFVFLGLYVGYTFANYLFGRV